MAVHCIDESVEQIMSGTVSCKTLIEQTIKEISTEDTRFNSFISLCNDYALKQAESIDSLSKDEKKKLPLLGVPIALKDNICTKGHVTTCGSRMLESFIPPYNATVVDLLETAGAVIVGKANMDEFAMGSSCETSYFGPVRNPHNPAMIPGGSSGGSAVAVSAGLVPAALGSDTGGSIRQPCSHCGVPGLKPTYGRVSRYGLVAFGSSLDQIGPIATNVKDIARLLSVLSAPDTHDSTCSGKPFTFDEELFSGDIKDIRIGIPKEYFSEGLSDEVIRAMDTCKQFIIERGAVPVEISLPNIHYAIATYYIICTAEASSNLARYDGVKYGFRAQEKTLADMYEETRHQGFGAEVKRRIMLGTYVLSSGYYDAYYLKAQRVRALIQHDFEKAFSRCDVIMSPVTPSSAFPLGENVDDPLQMYLTDIFTVSANLAGIPGISVPCTVPEEQMPVGVQFMAPHWCEDLLCRMGAVVELMKV